MRQIIPGGEPFFNLGSSVGCLLIHGFPGAPEEMRWLGRYLADQGFSTLGIRLFGHGTKREDLMRASQSEWLACVEDGYEILHGVCEQIVLIGLSFGGMLSLVAARELDLSGLVILATPFELPPLARRLRTIAPLLSLVWRYRTPPEGSDWHDKQAEALNVAYSVQPLKAVVEVYDLSVHMRVALPEVRIPTLLLYSRGDGTVPPAHADWLLAALGSGEKELLWVERSGHVLPRDAERERVFHSVGSFVRRVTTRSVL